MLTIDGVGRVYPNGTRALERIGLTLEAGEILAVVGGSGCGKSTLLRLVSGLDRASEGRILVDGAAIAEPHPAVGIIFQEPRLLPWLDVADNVGFGIAHLPRAEREGRIAAVLAKVGLADYARRWPRELSGGQAQRVAIARALVARPSVLLLDEPFSALDAFTRADLQDHLLDLWAESRPTMVLVTHDIEEALVLADRIVVMQPKPGRIAAETRVALPRPRDRLAPEFEEAKRRILRSLDDTLSTRPRGEEIAPAAAI
ncbi:ABC transporter ATP-binding protein [Prosthecomicrobium hirschii]|uniref:ABC transporter ATP-binding protein n=1 Tax=Prosthecodimorpha hirschii TaxID=665126 RepID=UPI00221E71E7|nr:ABC transporter ATP-binding protein [Prosthecomicrobium hirschii]MCW1843656.1 ABC transporter ATP-binding protein [Prosthecomicrobium hirschii]